MSAPKPYFPTRPPDSLWPRPPFDLPPTQPCGGLPGRRFTDTGVLLGLGSEPEVLDEVVARWGDRFVIVDKVAGELYGISQPDSDAAQDVRRIAGQLHARLSDGRLPARMRLTDADRAYADQLHDQLAALVKIGSGRSQGETHVMSALLRRGDRRHDTFLANDAAPSRLARRPHGLATGTVAAVLQETVHAELRTAQQAFALYERMLTVSGVAAPMQVTSADAFTCRC